jgi:hypothetical protein
MMRQSGTAYINVALPYPWPPVGMDEYAKGAMGKLNYSIGYSATGRIVIKLSEDGHEIIFQSQVLIPLYAPVTVDGENLIASSLRLITVRWDEFWHIRLNIGQQEIFSETVPPALPVILPCTSPLAVPKRKFFADLNMDFDSSVGLNFPEDERHFVETVKDLDDKLADGGSYRLKKASGLIRLLLIDEFPLAPILAARFGKKLRFKTADYKSAPPRPDRFSMFNISLDVSWLLNVKYCWNTIEEFLKAPAATSGNLPLTVKDFVKLVANVKGGVHSGKVRPDEQGQQRLVDNEEISIDGVALNISTIEPIGRVVLQALKPIVDAIILKYSLKA